MYYYYSIPRVVKMTKPDNVGKDMEQGKFPYAAGGGTMVQVLWKTVWYYRLKLRMHITCELAIPLLGTDRTEMHAHSHQETRNKNNHNHLIHNASREGKAPPATSSSHGLQCHHTII